MVGLMLCLAYLNGSILKCLEWFTIGSCLLKFCLHFVPFLQVTAIEGFCDGRCWFEGCGIFSHSVVPS